MTGALATPRYSAEDFETASIRSTAPSYVSEAPSYHSVAPYPEAVPPYSPPSNRSDAARPTSLLPPGLSGSRQQTIGLPPVPSAPLRSVPNLNNFRIATWSNMNSSPNVRQYQRVAQRRVSAQRDPVDSLRRVMTDRIPEEPVQERGESPSRPLEDPYLVGEVAASRARQERLARESGDDILVREDRQWDWWLLQMKDLDERERNWTRFRRDAEMSSRKKLLRRLGGRRLMM
ncbi:hypothetical protein B0J13DRAFT_171231 [Dactylonectria estremocensis]|uniref:Uncharacterized protein n=1 Tax=Dactylonectria estremocensis TaxID=1079267 RepID=A0A9P9FCV7_9HYPO|nr:hypothetical protein B0J13DRAFT_171231 [Dactylonectria estremocensis]